ncbi:NAD-dependent epimerase/dehydratase family protein [Pendulispora rubella]|uniref:NAD-dependent epimerase/dehydratase family protein n=1 Tax=Pendulispora rubella TaxID=2741070 RepID=A0ABZ2L3P4_9BACT
MRIVVTGAAGFVGSHLSERLVALGHDVVGIDRFTDYYPRAAKEKNLERLRDEPRFSLSEVDLGTADLEPVLDGAEVIFHQAAQPGVRASWGRTFDAYLRDNVLATQRLLEAAKSRRGSPVRRVVYASSSSVYGNIDELPMRESSVTRPFSPYGVTKLAAEHLCELYRMNHGIPTTSLRYFTVYGPRQRPDMAFHKFIVAARRGEKIPLFGDGEQTRDFTFVGDVVEANIAAMNATEGGVFNIGGGSRVTMNQVLATLGEVVGPLNIEHGNKQLGDVNHTWADTTRARTLLGFAPKVTLAEGLRAEAEWLSAVST